MFNFPNEGVVMNSRMLLSLILCLGTAVATVTAHDACMTHESCSHVQKNHTKDCDCCDCDDCDEDGCDCGKNCHKCDMNS